MLDEFNEDTDGLNIEGFVFMECDCIASQRYREVETITKCAASDPRLKGIVAQVPLENGDSVRDELSNLTKNRLVKGVRRITQTVQDPEFCNQPGFVDGTRALSDFGLTCDLCISEAQLEATTRLVRACPSVNFILDHIGKPDIRGKKREPWASDLKAMSELPNVVCKLSGVVTEADHKNWKYADLEFYLKHTLECFGPDRLVYGGDWPVVRLAASYKEWVECVDQALAALTPTERQKIFRENAMDFYRLSQGVSGN